MAVVVCEMPGLVVALCASDDAHHSHVRIQV